MKNYFKLCVLHFFLQLSTISSYFPVWAVASDSDPTTSATTASAHHKSFYKIDKGDSGDPIVAIEIPHGASFQNSYPRLQVVSNSKFIGNEEIIADNRKIMDGLASKFRSVRAYPMEQPSSRYYQRISRFDRSSWGGQWFNQLRRRTNSVMSPTMNYDNQRYQHQGHQGSLDEPEMAASHDHGGGYGKGVNKSAVGLLGFLSLLSLIQNVLNQTRSGRRKRDVHGDMVDLDFEDVPITDWGESVKETALLVPLVLPMLNAVAHAQSGVVPIKCTLQHICVANQVLLERLGEQRGKSVGLLLSSKLAQMFTRQRSARRWQDFDISGRIIRAGKSGRSGKDCNMLYESCPELATKLNQLPKSLQRVLG